MNGTNFQFPDSLISYFDVSPTSPIIVKCLLPLAGNSLSLYCRRTIQNFTSVVTSELYKHMQTHKRPKRTAVFLAAFFVLNLFLSFLFELPAIDTTTTTSAARDGEIECFLFFFHHFLCARKANYDNRFWSKGKTFFIISRYNTR